MWPSVLSGKDLFGAPYDWRFTPDALDSMGYFIKLKVSRLWRCAVPVCVLRGWRGPGVGPYCDEPKPVHHAA